MVPGCSAIQERDVSWMRLETATDVGHCDARQAPGATCTGTLIMLRLLSVTALLLVTAPVMAQNPQPTDPTNPTVPMAPPNAPSPPPERIAPAAKGNLSDRLARENGTITPPNVDPGMTVTPPPRTGARTPIIPPPGSPGGNPSVVPK
jgi:hypothetical protein